MSSGSRFIAAGVAALVVSVASAGFVVARRSASPAPVASEAAAAEPTPVATPSPALESELPDAPAAAASPEAIAAPLKRKPAPARAANPAKRANVEAPQPAPERAVETPGPVSSPSSAPPVERPTATPAPTVAPVVEAPVEAPRRQFEEHTVNADSVIGIRLGQPLSSATAKVEDRVSAFVSNGVIADGRTVVPAGSRLEGTVTVVQPGSKFKGRARLGIRFHTLVLADGMRVPIQTEALYRDGDSATASTATKVGAGAAAGAIIGGLLGGKRGAILGGAVGAGGGTAAVAASGAKEAVMASDSDLSMRLTAPATITVERDPARR